MSAGRALGIMLTWLVVANTAAAAGPMGDDTRAAQNAALLEELRVVHAYTGAELEALQAVFAGSPVMGQGNPAITRHAESREACRARLETEHVVYANPDFEAICGGRYMAPLYDPARERPQDARACIDQFEFPDIPCDYPVVWTRAEEAAQACSAVGKRLCDAHEWEGACDGALLEPDYRFDLARGLGYGDAVARMRYVHNAAAEPHKRWSYGPQYERGVCAAASTKSPDCDGGNWRTCGSNTYPAGAFPACHSELQVYDLNGNAAEHMNLPLAPDQMASSGSTTLGVTEMKGSWFIFDTYRAHPDWCRWRAPFWHGGRVLDAHSHENYHLGFRCCKTLPARNAARGATDIAAPAR